jgi:hypothetical protein
MMTPHIKTLNFLIILRFKIPALLRVVFDKVRKAGLSLALSCLSVFAPFFFLGAEGADNTKTSLFRLVPSLRHPSLRRI